MNLRFVIFGLSITSSWGNGHATTYRALIRALTRRGHDVLFLERDRPWYASTRDRAIATGGRVALYESIAELKDRFTNEVAIADVVIVGSYVPRGVLIGKWVNTIAAGLTAFYDIDTPVTLSKLMRGDYQYIEPNLIPQYDLYLSFTGGPVLRTLKRKYGSPQARAFYCSVDPDKYKPAEAEIVWDLGYLGTYSVDRQPGLEKFLIEPARQWREGRFVVAGPQYPRRIRWPRNVRRIEHLAPRRHSAFYNAQRFTLNITRADMRHAGYSPSVRLFEAAACGTPIISDDWPGLNELFTPGREIIIAHSCEDVRRTLGEMSESRRIAIAGAARRRVLAEHTADHRAEQLESDVLSLLDRRAAAGSRVVSIASTNGFHRSLKHRARNGAKQRKSVRNIPCRTSRTIRR